MSGAVVTAKPLHIDAKIRSLLSAFRARVRGYIFCEGVAWVLVWCAATFCLGWALDYLPVLLGADEMPRFARALWLLVMIGGALFLTWRYLIQRLFIPLPDRSLALLVERKYRDLQESMITSVELAGRDLESTATANMLTTTHEQATASLGQVQLRALFNLAPLWRAFTAVVLLAIVLCGATAWHRAGMLLAVERLYLLSEEPWPRFARLEMVGVEARRTAHEAAGIAPQSLEFTNQVVKVARGSNLTLKVRGDAAAAVLPKVCVLHYRSDDGDTGSVTLKTLGRVQDGFQLYACDTKPLAGILSSLQFDVLGYDHRLRDHRMEVVDSPAISSVSMDVSYPRYMVDEEQAIRTPRSNEPVTTANNTLPQGTQVLLHLQSSKPLLSAEVKVMNPAASETESVVVKQQLLTFTTEENVTSFDYALDALTGNRTVEILLRDTDGVQSERWFRIFFTAVADEAPRWEFSLRGIGTEVTSDVNIPIEAKVSDDYGIAQTWLETKFAETTHEFPVKLAPGGKLMESLDFRRLRAENSLLELRSGMKLSVMGKGRDRFDLADKPNIGNSEQFSMEVVTPDKLLAGLEAREIALRRRLEQILTELNDTRDSLLRVRPGQIELPMSSAETAEPTERKITPEQQLAREVELRMLRVQRAIQQIRKSWQEVAGVADSFDLIREELINNRVDTQERKQRLQELIANPLHEITKHEFPDLEKQLMDLEPVLEKGASRPLAEQTVANTNELIAKLEQILQKMLKLESYNEILDLVRDILRDQQSLREDTKREQKRELEE
jgi:hypothetical protein